MKTCYVLSEEHAKCIAIAGWNVAHQHSVALGDTSVREWRMLSAAQQNLLIRQAKKILVEGQTTEDIHEGWLAEMTQKGWTYADVMDASTKTSPLLRPYAEINDHRKTEDFLFLNVCELMAQALMLEVRNVAAA